VKRFPRLVRYRYAIFDHDSKFDADVIALFKATGLFSTGTRLFSATEQLIGESCAQIYARRGATRGNSGQKPQLKTNDLAA
jgi:hypothetical protein